MAIDFKPYRGPTDIVTNKLPMKYIVDGIYNMSVMLITYRGLFKSGSIN